MRNNHYQQLDLFGRKDTDKLPADIMDAIQDAKFAWLKRIHSKRQPRYVVFSERDR